MNISIFGHAHIMHPVTISPDVSGALLRDGYALATGSDFATIEANSPSLIALTTFWNNLVVDPYLPEQFGKRYRRHGRLICDTQNHKLCYVPGSSVLSGYRRQPSNGWHRAQIFSFRGGRCRKSNFSGINDRKFKNVFWRHFTLLQCKRPFCSDSCRQTWTDAPAPKAYTAMDSNTYPST